MRISNKDERVFNITRYGGYATRLTSSRGGGEYYYILGYGEKREFLNNSPYAPLLEVRGDV